MELLKKENYLFHPGHHRKFLENNLHPCTKNTYKVFVSNYSSDLQRKISSLWEIRKKQIYTTDVSTWLQDVTTEFVGFNPQSVVLKSVVLGWILIYRNWSIDKVRPIRIDTIYKTKRWHHFTFLLSNNGKFKFFKHFEGFRRRSKNCLFKSLWHCYETDGKIS